MVWPNPALPRANFAEAAALWNGDFPTALSGVSVTVNNKPAYLWYVSPSQINAQAPDDSATGPVSAVVSTAKGSVTGSVTLAAASPCFITLGDGQHVAAIIATPDGSGTYGGGTYDLLGPTGAFPYATRPARPGESIVLYGIGFGPTNPAVPAGAPYAGAAPTRAPVAVSIGGVSTAVAFAGITSAGLYQFNLTVPDIGAGEMPLSATVSGAAIAPGGIVSVGPGK